MAYETVQIIWHKPARATQPGGLIHRKDPVTGEHVTHRFIRPLHSRHPSSYYWGHYFNGPDAEKKARADFMDRRSRIAEEEVDEAVLIAKGDVGYEGAAS